MILERTGKRRQLFEVATTAIADASASEVVAVSVASRQS